MKDRFTSLRERAAIVISTIAGNIVAQVVVILWLHQFLFERLFRHAQLRFAQYFEPYLIVEAAQDLGFVTLVMLPLLVLFLARRHTRWEDIDVKRRARWFVWIIAGIFAWAFSTYDVNLFFDQSHWLDRVLLVGLWVALYFHPMALVPFLATLLMIATQQHYPLPEGPWTWPDKRLPLDLLIVFASYTLVAAVLRERMRPYVLPLLLLCMTGATYGHAAVNKLLLGPSFGTWLLHDDLGNLFVSSYVNGGWLRELGDDRIVSVAHVLHALKIPLAFLTILAEGSGFALVVRWRLTRLLLPGFVVFHIAILASSGIFFWKWMVCDLLLVWYLSRLRRDEPDRVAIFRPQITALALTVMIAARFYFNLVPFAWFDTKLVNYFEIHGVADSGHRYRLDARFFAPYDIHIQQSRHYSAVKGPVLVGTYGTSLDWNITNALETARPEDLPALRRQYGQTFTSAYWAFGFFEFVRRYVDNAQHRGGRRSFMSWIAPPFHFRTTQPDDVFDFQEHLNRIEIEFFEYLYDGDVIIQTRRIPVVSFSIDTPIRQPR